HTMTTLFPYTTLFRSLFEVGPGNDFSVRHATSGAITSANNQASVVSGTHKFSRRPEDVSSNESVAPCRSPISSCALPRRARQSRSEEHTSELQSRENI